VFYALKLSYFTHFFVAEYKGVVPLWTANLVPNFVTKKSIRGPRCKEKLHALEPSKNVVIPVEIVMSEENLDHDVDHVDRTSYEPTYSVKAF